MCVFAYADGEFGVVQLVFYHAGCRVDDDIFDVGIAGVSASTALLV